MLKVALTHDVDRARKTYQYLTGFMKGLSKGNISESFYHIKSFFGKEPYWNFYEIASLEKSYGLRSTFFILDESISYNPLKPDTFVLAVGRYNMFEPKIQEAIRYLDTNGWEIGLHGSFLSYNNKALLIKEKNRLESIIGHPVIGTRQHHLNLDDSTWKIHEELKFEYDSTWGHNRDIGFKDGKILPFHPNNSAFVVFPLTIMDICFMNTKNRWERFNEIIAEVEKEDGILVLNFHHRVYNEKEFPGYKEAYIRIIEESLKRNAIIGPLAKFYHEYKKKNIIAQ